MDKATLIGLLLGGAAIIGGQYLEGGSLGMIFQATAMIIVFGGTLGAVFLSFPAAHLRAACQGLGEIFWEPEDKSRDLIAQITEFAYRTRRVGILSLEPELENLADPFYRRTLQLAVDGLEPEMIREIMELELQQLRTSGSVQARVFEAAGGYAPTFGILGAVLGLIQVMNFLTEPSKLGPGIALAFVATVYGVGSANLFFLPISHKLKLRYQRQLLVKELVLEGILSVSLGEHPRFIEEKLTGLLAGTPPQAASPLKSKPAPEFKELTPPVELHPEPEEYATSPVSQT